MSGPCRDPFLEDAQRAIGYRFKDVMLLREALTHGSYGAENPFSPTGDNGRLSLLGDAAVSLIVAERLFGSYPGLSTGGISRARAAVVSGRSLAEASARLGLGRFVLLGKGESSDGGREKTRLLADLFEAVTGAVYRDGGPEAARAFVLAHLQGDIDKAVLSL